jgi:hypothetical protein
MKSLKIPGKNEAITGDWLASLGECIQELQRQAVTSVQSPLWFASGTLGSVSGGDEFWAHVESADGHDLATHAGKGFAVQWSYEFYEVRFDGADYETVDNGRTNDTAGTYAFNVAELDHPGNDEIFGVDVTGDDYPDGFKPIPLHGIVRIRVERDKNGDKLYLFDRMGSHDGTCEAQA